MTAREIHLGPLTVPGAKNRVISGEKLPLVVVSHPLQRGVRCELDLGEGALPMRLPPLRRCGPARGDLLWERTENVDA
jgi:hypothetical protein